MENSKEQLDIASKIALYEEKGYFDQDIFLDPPTIPIKPGQVDYLKKKLTSKIKTRIANRVAFNYFERMIKKNQIIIKEVKGIENFESVQDGAIITANHFHPFDNYAIYHAIYKSMKKEGKKDLWKVIREGNYSQFAGLYGFFFRNCNTLPLAADFQVMKEFLSATSTLLKEGEKILIYPEQALWPNYKKPRPLKPGAFDIAVRNNVAVIPIFIEIEPSNYKDKKGNPLDAWTLHILEPIYPDMDLNKKDRSQKMMNDNYEAFKNKYEEVYHEKLKYTSE